MASSAELAIWLKMHGADQVKSQMDDVSTKAGHFGKALGDVSKIASGFVMGSALMQAPDFLMSAAQDAADEAAAIARLQQAVENTGASWVTYGDRMEGVVDAGIKLGFTDDDTRSALALLTAQTSDADEAMRRFSLAQDLSRGANIDLVTASKLLGKVTDENVNVLARYGIKAQEGMDQTQLFGLIQQKFGGQAEAFGKSTAGQMAQAKIAMQELKEQLGYALLPAMAALAKVLNSEVIPYVQKVVAQVGPAIDRFTEWAENSKQVQYVLENVKVGLQVLGEAVQKVTTFIMEHKAALIATGVVLGILLVALQPVPAAILAITFAIGVLSQNWDSIRAKTLEVWNAISAFLDERLPYLKEVIVGTFNVIKTDVETAITLVRDVINIVMALLHGDWSAAWDGIKTLAGDALQGLMDSVVAKIALFANVMRFLAAAGVSAFQAAFSPLGDALADIWNGVIRPVLQAMCDAYNNTIGKLPSFMRPGLPSSIGPVAGVGGGASYTPETYPMSPTPGQYTPQGPMSGPPETVPVGKMGGAYGPTAAGAGQVNYVYNPTFVYQGSATEALAAMGAAL